MMENKETRDILDVSTAEGAPYPEENMPKTAAERPVVGAPDVSPQEGGYFLNKFLEESNRQEAEGTADEQQTPASPAQDGDLKDRIVEALQEIYDPEIPVNIYELGLIYDVDISGDNHVDIRMTLTTPHCPVAESMPGEVELKVNSVEGVKSVEVKLVWEPAWDMSKMSDEARLELGLL